MNRLWTAVPRLVAPIAVTRLGTCNDLKAKTF